MKTNVATAALGIACLASFGVVHAGTITTTSVSMPNGSISVNIHDSSQNINGGGSGTGAGMFTMQTSVGSLNTYCVDLFDYIDTGSNGYTFDNNQLAAGQSFRNGNAAGTWTANQVNLLTALLTNGALQSSNSVNSAALQIAIWEVEYDTAASNGTYSLTSHDGFYFSTTSDSHSQAALTQAQAYLNDVTGYSTTSHGHTTWVDANWDTDGTHVAMYLTSDPSGTQNQIYLGTPPTTPVTTPVPEPSAMTLFGVGLAGIWRARRRKRATRAD